MIKELDDVILTCDMPQQGLSEGDIGAVVLVHKSGQGFEVEFTALNGKTIAVVTLHRSQLRPVQEREIAHARQLIYA